MVYTAAAVDEAARADCVLLHRLPRRLYFFRRRRRAYYPILDGEKMAIYCCCSQGDEWIHLNRREML